MDSKSVNFYVYLLVYFYWAHVTPNVKGVYKHDGIIYQSIKLSINTDVINSTIYKKIGHNFI